MNHVAKKQQGFTIIELMLAMTFVSFLLIGIAMTVIQIAAIYNKGTTLKEINQVSRELNDDLRRNIGVVGNLDVTTDYVLSPATATPSSAVGGRLCLGSYSYIWNYAKALGTSAVGVTKYQDDGSTSDVNESNKPLRLIKVADSSKVYCAINAAGSLSVQSVLVADQAKAFELLKSGDHDLGIHQFVLNVPPASAKDDATGQQLYSISYIIGTSKTSAMNSDQTACLAPDVPNSDSLYCNIQQFGLVVRAGK